MQFNHTGISDMSEKELQEALRLEKEKRENLIRYNDLHKDYTLADGDVIYLHAKKKKASKNYIVHVVKDGDSMHSISQTYGIRLKNLYKMNRKDAEYVPEVGDRLRLR